MVDFSALLRKPLSEVKKPPMLPIGDYRGRIKGFTTGDQNKNRTPYVRFELILDQFPDEVSEDDKAGIDLSKRNQRRDFYLSEDAMFRLKEFVESLGINAENLEEALPQTVGSEVIIEIVGFVNQSTNEPGTQVGRVTAAA